MRTAVDSSVLLDVFGADQRFGEPSRSALRSAYDAGALVACEVVWAEVRAHFPTEGTFEENLRTLGVRFDVIRAETAATAGRIWRESRLTPGGGRKRLVADFLIGAHGRLQADRLLSRDRGFFRRHFQGLNVIDPAGA